MCDQVVQSGCSGGVIVFVAVVAVAVAMQQGRPGLIARSGRTWIILTLTGMLLLITQGFS